MQVIEVGTRATLGVGNSTKGILLDTNNPHLFGLLGKQFEIDEKYRGFVSEGDKRLREQLSNVGWGMRVRMIENGEQRVTFEKLSLPNSPGTT